MNKKIIASLIILAASLALGYFFIPSHWSSVEALRTELSQKKQTLNELNELLEKISQIEGEYQNISDEAQKIFLSLPAKRDIPYLLVHFENLASSNGLLLESINFGQLGKNEQQTAQQTKIQSANILSNLPCFTADLNMTGSYEAFKNYLAALEKSARLMDVKSASFAIYDRSNLSAGLGIFNFNLSLNVYYLD
jgi:Tfp pilus assembly protein PilO